MKKKPIAEVPNITCLINDKKEILDPWGDCHAATALINNSEHTVEVGESDYTKAIHNKNSKEVEALLDIMIETSSPKEWESKKNGNRWLLKNKNNQEIIFSMIRHAAFLGGNILDRKIWFTRWQDNKQKPKQILFSKKTKQVLINLDLEPRNEKIAWIHKSLKENPKRRILLFGTRKFLPGANVLKIRGIVTTGEGCHVRSNLPFEIQPSLF